LLEIFDLSRYVKDLKYQSVVPNTVTTQNVFTVKDLNFEYETKGRKVLAGVTLQISKGESIGLYGAIGSGKTTFLKLLSGLLDAPKNTILLYGTDLADVSREWLTSQLVMVPQKSFLFAGSIRYNLELSDSFSDDALWRVLRLVELEEDVRRFHNGLNCWVGEWGVNLSGGQKQRLSLARALLRPRGILLLDDCLSAVDAVTEERILTNMKKELGELTVVWVAHRQSTLKLCKRVFSLENGRLQEPRSKALKFEGQSKTLEVPRGVDL
jgi:ATP-binding cassette subfamily B protein